MTFKKKNYYYFNRKAPISSSDTFCQATSLMHRFTSSISNSNREFKWFKICAENYLLSGKLNNICDHNSTVAKNAGRNDVSCKIFFFFFFN